MISPEQAVVIRIGQLEALLDFMATRETRRDNPANRERARKLWLEIVRLSTLIASQA